MKSKKDSNTERGNDTTPCVSNSAILWKTLESENTDIVYKQHGFKPNFDKYCQVERGISLCGKYVQVDDEGKSMKIDEMWVDGSEEMDEKKVCKKCLAVYRKHYC